MPSDLQPGAVTYISAEEMARIRAKPRDPITEIISMLADIVREQTELREMMTQFYSDFTVFTQSDEFNAKRKELSLKLGEAVQRRLAAEKWARDMTTGQT